MESAALGAFLSAILNQIATPAVEKLVSVCCVKKDIKKLQSRFEAIKAVLDDAEEQQWTNNKLRVWLEKLWDVAYDVEDILDDFAVEEHRRRDEINRRFKNKVRDFFTHSNPVLFQIKMERRVKEVVERLEEIAKEKSDFSLTENIGDNLERRRMNYPSRTQTHSYIHKSDVIGRDDDKERLVELLLNMDGLQEEENVSYIPIVGMGGIGKTTLAQFVYNDGRVMEYFDRRMWAYVSQNFNLAEILRATVASANGEDCNFKNMDVLQSRLRIILQEKRYLLVLDDVWNENVENWSQLRTLLKSGKKGSKVIVTTRSEVTASIMSPSSPIYYLKTLNTNDCLSLFIQCAFPAKDEEAYPNLVQIGKAIVNKCGGLPLAIKVLGGLLMNYKTSETEWLSVRDDPLWKVNDDNIFASLRLSYNYLPSHLKQCFAYLSIFLKGEKFSKNYVAKMWIAEGFIQSTEGEHKKMEDIGEEYFRELCQRSLLQFYGNRRNNIYANWWSRNEKAFIYMDEFFNMHDLVHDLATIVAGLERSPFSIEKTQSINKSTRHLLVNVNSRKAFTNRVRFHRRNKLRSIVLENLLSSSLNTKFLHEICGLTHLRILEFCRANITTFPESIGNLKQLRYLDLSYNDFEMLPKSLTSLTKLQTLFLVDCESLKELPGDMCNMLSLRNLMINCHWNISIMPPRIGHLTCLQTLSFFVVGEESGCGIQQLQNLNLRGALTIRSLQNVLNPAEAEQAGLKQKKNLENLRLCWKQEGDSNVGTFANSENIIESLQPPVDIKCLGINNYMGKSFPMWLMDLKIPKLVDLSLYDCKRCKTIPPLWRLSSLRILRLEGMPMLERWSSNVTIPTLPHVERLVIKRCPVLTHIPHLPSLNHLELVTCHELILSSKIESVSLRELTVGGFADLTSFPQGLFPNKAALSYLEICDCPRLKSLPEEFSLQTTIEYLKIVGCHEIESLMKGWRILKSLEYLELANCYSLKSLPGEEFCQLSSLKRLRIFACQNLVSLDEGLQHLTSLAELHLSDCPNMVALPKVMRKLKALVLLHLEKLPELQSLDEVGTLISLEKLQIISCHSILALPESLENVTTLHQLEIVGCPQLQSRCTKDIGEDWRKIDHVPLIKVLPG